MQKFRTICSTLILTMTVTVFLLWCIGQITRDSSWLFGLMFYIPSPVLLLWLAGFAWQARRRSSRRCLLLALMALPPLYFVVMLENHFDSRARSSVDTPVRLIHWNICWCKMGWDRQKALIRTLDADIIVLSEPSEQITASDFPGYVVERTKDMLIAGRGPIRLGKSLVPGGALEALPVECDLVTGTVKLIMADMTSNIRLWRDPYLRPFLKVIEERQPDLIVGDFNAPRRSLAFSELPEGYQHAYDSCGSGVSYTWPVPVPFLAIDQCIHGPQVDALRYELHSSVLSDHRLQLLEFMRR
ncbi:MAG: hypothetical protein U0996_27255 [Planctomycetaceae bacterium]